MPHYNVYLYREICLIFHRIEAGSPEAAAAIARDGKTRDADDIDDCDGKDFAAIVDVIGDDNFKQSKTIEFEAGRLGKPTPALSRRGRPVANIPHDNADRAHRCRRAIESYEDDDLATNLIDLLCDARHWCDDNAEDFGDLDRQAYRHYLAELDASRKPS